VGADPSPLTVPPEFSLSFFLLHIVIETDRVGCTLRRRYRVFHQWRWGSRWRHVVRAPARSRPCQWTVRLPTGDGRRTFLEFGIRMPASCRLRWGSFLLTPCSRDGIRLLGLVRRRGRGDRDQDHRHQHRQTEDGQQQGEPSAAARQRIFLHCSSPLLHAEGNTAFLGWSAKDVHPILTDGKGAPLLHVQAELPPGLNVMIQLSCDFSHFMHGAG